MRIPAFTARSPIVTFAIDRETFAIVEANPAAIASLGPLVGADLRARWIDPDAGRAALERAVRDGGWVTWQQRGASGEAVEVEAAVVDDGAGWIVQARRVGAGESADELRVRLGALIEHAHHGVAIHAADGRLEYVSPAIERIIGVGPSALGEDGARLSDPADVEKHRPMVRNLTRAPGATHTFVSRIVRPDGGERWIEATLTNLLHEPSVRGLVSQFRDVSDRVVAERQRDDVLRRYAHLLSATSAVTYSLSIERPINVTFIGENVTAVLGYAPAQLLEDRTFWRNRVHPDDRARVIVDLDRMFAVGRRIDEYRVRHADGAYRWVHDDLTVVRDDEGRPRELIGFFFDVSARREAEEARRRSEVSFRALIENVPLAIAVHRDDRILYVNPPMIRLLGHTRAEELIGRSPLTMVAPSQREAAAARVRHLESTPGTPHNPLTEGEAVRADGSLVAVEVESVKLDFDGAPASVVLMRDLTERRAMVARMAASDRLASVGTLAAGVAHEINNPLTFVLTNLSLLAADLPALLAGDARARVRAGDVERLLRDARDGAVRIRALVGDLRTMSHPDQTSEARVELREVLERCLRMADNEIRHRARLDERYGEAPPVLGNPTRLSQVFLNLIINAAHAIPEGRVAANRIRVVLGRSADGDAQVEISDTGAGIAPEILPRIFEPFFTTKPPGLGTGLGLAICHGIVSSMGGEITVDSAPGRGATFRVRLPRAYGVAPVIEPAAAVAPPARRLRVLVIDDEPAIGRSLSLLLAPHHEVQVETRAAQALAALERDPAVDVILCDLMMPEMNGMAFYAAVAERWPALAERMIFLTGGAFTAASQAFLDRVPNPRLDKPFDLDALYALLDAVRERG